MGLGGGKAGSEATKKQPMKKPAGLQPMKKPAGSQTFAKRGCHVEQSAHVGDGPWLKLLMTYGRKPERSYVMGAKHESAKPRVIVGVTKTQSKQYRLVMDKIVEALKKENLTKSQAIELRDKLLEKYQ